MRLYRLKADPEGPRGLPEYLANHYVSFGEPGSGDWSRLDRARLEELLGGAEANRQAEDAFVFAHVMQDGDYVLATDGERLVLGDMGDYYYLEEFDNAESRSGHRRGVTWLRSLRGEELHPELQAFLREDGELGLFGREVTREELERLLVRPAEDGSGRIDEATIREALDVLRAAMRSDDADRRERAAIAILQAAQWLNR